MLQKATSQWCNEIILLVLFTCVGTALLCVGYASRVALVRLVYKRRFVYVQIQSEAVPKARANEGEQVQIQSEADGEQISLSPKVQLYANVIALQSDLIPNKSPICTPCLQIKDLYTSKYKAKLCNRFAREEGHRGRKAAVTNRRFVFQRNRFAS